MPQFTVNMRLFTKCLLILQCAQISVSLICYQCYRTPDNVLCNENEPMKCGPIQQKCGIDDSTPNTVQKGCIENCPLPSRGDNAVKTCSSCSGDFCNLGPRVSPPVLKEQSREFSFGSLKLSIFNKPSTFWEARSHCAKLGQRLATILEHDLEELIEDEIEKLEKNNPTDHGYWFGARWIKEENHWIWTDTGNKLETKMFRPTCPSYQNWASGEPKYLTNRNYCAFIKADGSWFSGSCGEISAGFICQSSGNSENSFTQTVSYRGQLYTFHTSETNQSQARKICSETGGKLARFDDDISQNHVTSKLNYCLNSEQYWVEQQCENNPPVDHRNTFGVYSCSTKQPFLCQREFNANDMCHPMSTNAELTTATHKDLKPTEPWPEKNVTEYSFKCKYMQTMYRGKLYRFPAVEQGRFSSSLEKCASQRPLASIFCPTSSIQAPRFDRTSFVMTPCYTTLDCVQENVNEFSRGIPTEDEVKSLSGSLRVLTSKPSNMTHENVTQATDILKSIDAMTQKERSSTLVTPIVLIDLLTTIDNLHNKVAELSKVEEKIELANMVENFASKVVLDSNQDEFKLEGNNIDVKAVDYNIKETSNFSTAHATYTFKKGPDGLHSSHLTIQPSETVQNSRKLRAIFVGFSNNNLFPAQTGTTSQVISATLIDEADRKVSVPVAFAFQRSEQAKYNKYSVESCSFYDPLHRKWIEDGCYKGNSSDNDTIQCFCNHTTSFAVVVRMQQGDSRAHMVLDIVSKVGLFICVICFTLTVILFFILPELRRINSSDVHANLCVCLILSYVGFLAGIERTANRPLCVAVAATIQYFLLCAWGWMAVESFTMYRMFVHMFEKHGVLNCRIMALVVYTLSAVAVGCTMSASYFNEKRKMSQTDFPTVHDGWNGYIGDQYCWLVGPSLYFGFLSIIGFILLGNIVVAFLVIRAITWGRAKVQSSTQESPAVHVLRALLVSVLLGMAWLFAVPLAVSSDHVVQDVFAWLFAISTSSQGVFVFYFFCVRRDDVRMAWTKPLCKVLCGAGWYNLRDRSESVQRTKSTLVTSPKSTSQQSVSNPRSSVSQK